VREVPDDGTGTSPTLELACALVPVPCNGQICLPIPSPYPHLELEHVEQGPKELLPDALGRASNSRATGFTKKPPEMSRGPGAARGVPLGGPASQRSTGRPAPQTHSVFKGTAQCSTAQRSAVQHGMKQRSRAQHREAQHSTRGSLSVVAAPDGSMAPVLEPRCK